MMKALLKPTTIALTCAIFSATAAAATSEENPSNILTITVGQFTFVFDISSEESVNQCKALKAPLKGKIKYSRDKESYVAKDGVVLTDGEQQILVKTNGCYEAMDVVSEAVNSELEQSQAERDRVFAERDRVFAELKESEAERDAELQKTYNYIRDLVEKNGGQ